MVNKMHLLLILVSKKWEIQKSLWMCHNSNYMKFNIYYKIHDLVKIIVYKTIKMLQKNFPS